MALISAGQNLPQIKFVPTREGIFQVWWTVQENSQGIVHGCTVGSEFASEIHLCSTQVNSNDINLDMEDYWLDQTEGYSLSEYLRGPFYTPGCEYIFVREAIWD